MDAIVALCHFCESHGPCVILCTQRSVEEPQKTPHSLTNSWCEACQSIDVEQALVSKEDDVLYVTTRTPQQQNIAFLLKQAAIRSLSCEEETSKEGGTLYFGDNERGHVISHSFTIRDSLARGFYRKYSILVLSRDKIHLLNSWPSLVQNMKSLVQDLQAKADKINGAEQERRSQRAVRQAEGCARNTSRSLSQLTGQPAVFGHLHLWFCFMLHQKSVVEKPMGGLKLPPMRSISKLRDFAKKCKGQSFKIASFCALTGIEVCCDNRDVMEGLEVLLPAEFNVKVENFNDNLYVIKGLTKQSHPPSTVTRIEIQNQLFSDKADNEHVDAIQDISTFNGPPIWSPLWAPLTHSKPPNKSACVIALNDDKWEVHWKGVLDTKLPTYLTMVERAVFNELLPGTALEPFINALCLKWLHVAQVLSWSSCRSREFLHSLGVQTRDMPLVNYWTCFI